MLRALILARHNDVGRQVCDAHGGVSGIYVLAAGAGRTIGIHTQIFFVDFNFDIFINFGKDEE